MSFLLVHGAFRGGWAWGAVRRGLTTAGHEVLAPTLVGMGELADHASPPAALHLSDWSSQLVQLAEMEDITDVVLVGHSQGGLVTREAASMMGSRLRALVHIDAPIATIGQRGIDLMGVPAPPASALPPRATVLPATPLEAGSHLSAGVAAWANERLGPTPFGPSLDPVTTAEPTAPVHVAFCAHTPPEYPAAVSRARFDEAGMPYQLFDAAHDVVLTEPDAVTRWLLDCAEIS